jgi:uncharacterized membrane protein HdeD (DUF308 family)
LLNLINKWKDQATQYIDLRAQLLKLGFIERVSKVLGSLMFSVILIMILMIVLLFIGFGIMETFIALFDSRIGGAFAAAGTFGILFTILFAFRKKITTGFIDMFVGVMTDEDDEESKKAN